jgi:hypothetical protein
VSPVRLLTGRSPSSTPCSSEVETWAQVRLRRGGSLAYRAESAVVALPERLVDVAAHTSYETLRPLAAASTKLLGRPSRASSSRFT